MAELCGVPLFDPVVVPVPKPDRGATAEEWLTYLRHLNVAVPHHITHQKVALIALAAQEEARRRSM
jgi:hypothetical protein